MNGLLKLLHIPPGKSIIYWLIEKEKGPVAQVLAFVAFSATLYYFLGSIEAAIAMMLGMYLHELGHFVVFAVYKIKAVILLIFPLGAVAAPINEDEDKRSDLLPWQKIATLLQIGVTVNVMLMVIGVILISIGAWPALGKQLIFINGSLAVLNLLPVWKLDGGLLFYGIFSSLREKGDRVLAVAGVVTSVMILVALFVLPISQGLIATLITFMEKGTLIFFLLVFILGVVHNHKKELPLGYNSSQAMSLKQVLIQLIWYVSLVISSILLLNLLI